MEFEPPEGWGLQESLDLSDILELELELEEAGLVFLLTSLFLSFLESSFLYLSSDDDLELEDRSLSTDLLGVLLLGTLLRFCSGGLGGFIFSPIFGILILRGFTGLLLNSGFGFLTGGGSFPENKNCNVHIR